MGKAIWILRSVFVSLWLALDIFLFYPLLCFLPYGWGYPVVRWRGNLHFRFMGNLRKKVLEDLAECLPERTEEERHQIARRSFQIQAAFFYDSYMLARYRIDSWSEKFINTDGLEHLEASMKKGKGVILCSMHFNHYFGPAGYLARRFPVVGYGVWPWDLTRINFFIKLHHRLVIMIGQWRSGFRFLGAGRHEKGELERVLNENNMLYILLDIPLPEMRDLKSVKFLGKEGMFPCGLILLKYMTKAAFHVTYMVRDPNDWRKQTLVVTPELPFQGRLAADHQMVVKELEKGVRKYSWLWWGWGRRSRMSPEYIEEAREMGNYATSIISKGKRRT